MQKQLLLAAGLLLSFTIRAQVVMNLQLPPLGITIKPQLWNLSLINSSGQNLQVRIDMVMTDLSSNQLVLSGSSPFISLPKGIKQVRFNDVMPVAYTAGTGYTISPAQDAFLPIGMFTICYTLIKMNNDAQEQISEECIDLEVEPVSPPQLMLPWDNDQLDVLQPVFSWLPPSPYDLFSNLLYDWTLVEVQPLQSPGDALQQNLPLLALQNLATASVPYPLSAPALDTAKLYAWRVSAKSNNHPVSNSEIWTFRVRKFAPDTASHGAVIAFPKLRPENDASYVICSGVLRYEYLHELADSTISIRITDVTHQDHQQVQLAVSQPAVKYGQNFLQADLTTAGLTDRHMYLLEVTNVRQERWFLRFEYRQPD